jgi:oligopeptide/dipeptide ABC transporter ATP-binding protein
MTLLEIKDLTVSYSTASREIKAVRKVSLKLDSKEVLGIVGESGSGKSTLGLSIMRLLPTPPARYIGGSIFYKGLDLLKIHPRLMNFFRGTEIAIIFQEPLTSLNPVLTIGEQISEALIIRKSRETFGEDILRLVSEGVDPRKLITKKRISNGELRKETIEILKSVRIADPERIQAMYPHQLSGGMRQRVMIAMALAERPSILIADEPTSALDVTTQAEILQLIKKLVSEERTAVIFITHDLAILRQVATRLAVMYAGKIVEEVQADELYSNPLHPYTKGLLASLPTGYKESGPLPTIPGRVPDLGNLPAGCKFHPRCIWAFERCLQNEPDLYGIGDKHKVACYLYSGEMEFA